MWAARNISLGCPHVVERRTGETVYSGSIQARPHPSFPFQHAQVCMDSIFFVANKLQRCTLVHVKAFNKQCRCLERHTRSKSEVRTPSLWKANISQGANDRNTLVACHLSGLFRTPWIALAAVVVAWPKGYRWYE